MARRAPMIAKKNKKIRVSHNESYIINRKYMGDEPEFLGAMTNSEYGVALNWYNAMCDINDARQYITDYLIKRNRKAEAKLLVKLDNCWVPTTVAWRCRMLDRGYEVPAEEGFLETTLAKALGRVARAEEEASPDSLALSKRSIQDRMRERQNEIIGEIEEILDLGGNELNLYDWLRAKEIPATYAPAIATYYAGPLTELIEAYEGKDPQLKEAYRHMTKKQLADRIKFMHTLVSDADKYAGVAKKTRAPRKPRAQSKEKILKNFKYQKEDSAFKIASINPEKIIGAQELWTFNTKYKMITVLRALDRGGLQVKGTSITGYDEATSMTKRTGRQPEKHLTSVTTGGKMILKKVLADLKDAPLAYRINENTILLRVM